MIARGYPTPMWPTEYGGGGLDKAQARVLAQELAAAGAYSPAVSFFGLAMLGPVLLEFGNDDQKLDHLPKITSGEIQWCQGYSEPGAGSDLAGLQTRAVLDGDHYIINGSKIWTTNANNSDWMFCLVRTDPDVPKHDGISFILFDLHSPGVTISPIKLISGESDFCQVFFEDVKAEAKNLVGPLNGGWDDREALAATRARDVVGRYAGCRRCSGAQEESERRRQEGRANSRAARLAELVRQYVGEQDGQLADASLRERIAQHELDSLCFGLSMRPQWRIRQGGPGTERGDFDVQALHERNEQASRRNHDVGDGCRRTPAGSGEGFSPSEIANTRGWLRSKGELDRRRHQ